MSWMYPALIVSLAANIGLLIYIVANHQLDKWEKRNATPRSVNRIGHQFPVDVHRTSSQPSQGE